MAFRIRWPTRYGRIIQRFGQNSHRYTQLGLPGHEGIDFVAPRYSPVFAVADGVVSDIRFDALADPSLRPYGNQVRIDHGEGFETVYGHLAQLVVIRGQPVGAKQLVALAGDTGYAVNAHLHLGLKKRGATQSGETGFPHDYVDPEPYLVVFGSEEDRAFELPDVSVDLEVDSPEAGFLSLRALPHASSPLITRLDHGAVLGALESADAVQAKLGRAGQWLWVKASDGVVGWAASAYLTQAAEDGRDDAQEEDETPISPDVVVFVRVETGDERLRMRLGPGADHEEVMRLSDGALLKVLERPESVTAKVGQQDAWIHVQAPTGQVGYCAAWYLSLVPFDPQPIVPQPAAGTPTHHVVVESPWHGLRLRAGPGTTYDRVWWMPHRTVLTSLEEPEATGHKVGQEDVWIHVRTPSRHEGYAAAWHLRYPAAADARQPVDRAATLTGLSPHIFGIHAISVHDEHFMRDRIRGLHHDAGKVGWVLFTEVCGRDARAIQLVPEVRRRLWDWADAGYGVVVRLNYGYEPGGTLPESRYYDDFAVAVARWVELHLADPDRSPTRFTWTLQIGNEQNNPREHPGGYHYPVEHITAAHYADAFNRIYARIKAVLPNAIVCPGAIDPYNYMPMRQLGDARWRPLDYFTTMMERIHALDGVILHAYTHGNDPQNVTHLKRFGNGTGPLWDHYYDFQIYRVFMERIPAKWRDTPVYVTEMNHIHRPAGEHDQGWANQNVGWVREVYAEIDRWNRQAYAQQIRCGLLYRWIGDAWAIEDKPEILTDYRQALPRDYRWRGGGFAV